MKNISVLFILIAFLYKVTLSQELDSPIQQRAYMVKSMLRIAEPVLTTLSKNELKKAMPVESKSINNIKYAHLEAFGRTLAGISPWLALGADDSSEGLIRKKYIDLSLSAIKNAVNPQASDFLNFKDGRQPLVDAAFLAQALLRAPLQLWEPLDTKTKQNLVDALKSTRGIKPGYNNWLLFSAIIEAALLKFTGTCDMMRVDYSIKQHLLWYKGDGAYGDGPNFHWDYYNSYVIHPMLLEILEVLKESGNIEADIYELELKRAIRYAEIQERLIASDGSYPPLGRSITYRFGAFQLLAKVALMNKLPKKVSQAQVRCALYAIVKKQIEAPNTFDDKGWLRIGFFGHQPELGESYISTGSLYLCTQVFLILGLSPNDTFWQAPNQDWTALRIWNGRSVPIDYATKDN